jgi:DNA-binding NarL/FixJ family response regulator
VLIVARNAFARVGLRALLESQASVMVIGDSAPDATLPRQVELLQPNALLWDLEWEADLEQLAPLSAELPPVLALLNDSALVSGSLGERRARLVAARCGAVAHCRGAGRRRATPDRVRA